MRPILILFLLLVQFITNVNGQDVVYSDFLEYDANNSSVAIIGKVNGNLYTYRSLGKTHFLEAFDEDMNRKATVLLDFFPEKIYQVRFVPFEDRILVLYQSQSGTLVTQYVAMLDNRGVLIKSPTKVDQKRGSFFGSSSKKQFFNTAVAENRSHVLVYSSEIKGKKIEFQGYWINPESMKVEKKTKWSYKSKTLINQFDGILTNNGVFILPIASVVGNKNNADDYAYLVVNKQVASYKKINSKLQGRFLEQPFQKINNETDEIYMASFYSDSKNGNNVGVAAMKFNCSVMAFEDAHFMPFNDEMRGNTTGRKRDKALNNFKINQLIIKRDGGIAVVAEEIYVVTQSSFMPGMGFYSFYYSPMMSRYISEYHYNDILVLSYNNQYQNEWNTFLRKQQYSQEDGGMFSSYTILNNGGGLGFLFNDYNTKRSRIQLSTIDASGKVNIGYLDAGNSNDPDWLPRIGKQIDKNQILVPCLRKKQLCFAKIIL